MQDLEPGSQHLARELLALMPEWISCATKMPDNPVPTVEEYFQRIWGNAPFRPQRCTVHFRRDGALGLELNIDGMTGQDAQVYCNFARSVDDRKLFEYYDQETDAETVVNLVRGLVHAELVAYESYAGSDLIKAGVLAMPEKTVWPPASDGGPGCFFPFVSKREPGFLRFVTYSWSGIEQEFEMLA